MSIPPGQLVGARLASFEVATSTLIRMAELTVAAIVLVGAVREGYRLGYRDGYRVADQVSLDRPRDEVPVP